MSKLNWSRPYVDREPLREQPDKRKSHSAYVNSEPIDNRIASIDAAITRLKALIKSPNRSGGSNRRIRLLKAKRAQLVQLKRRQESNNPRVTDSIPLICNARDLRRRESTRT